MYQITNKDKYKDIIDVTTQKEFEELAKSLTDGLQIHAPECIECMKDQEANHKEEYKKEWDLSKRYIAISMCNWQNPNNCEQECDIIMKNDKVALVMFDHQTEIMRCVYRLKDLKLVA